MGRLARAAPERAKRLEAAREVRFAAWELEPLIELPGWAVDPDHAPHPLVIDAEGEPHLVWRGGDGERDLGRVSSTQLLDVQIADAWAGLRWQGHDNGNICVEPYRT